MSKFGYVTSIEEANGYVNSCYENSPDRGTALVLRNSIWVVLMKGGRATDYSSSTQIWASPEPAALTGKEWGREDDLPIGTRLTPSTVPSVTAQTEMHICSLPARMSVSTR